MEHSKFVKTIRIVTSSIPTISPNKFYSVFVNGSAPYIYDDRAKKKLLDDKKVKWKENSGLFWSVASLS